MGRAYRQPRPARDRRRSMALIAALALVGLLAGGGMDLAGAASPELNLQMRTGPPTTKVTLLGTGFRAEESILLTFDADRIASSAASSKGTFTAKFRVPSSAPPGR